MIDKYGREVDDDLEPIVEQKEASPAPVKKSIYPSRIDLSEEDDVTLPFPNEIANIEDPVIPEKTIVMDSDTDNDFTGDTDDEDDDNDFADIDFEDNSPAQEVSTPQEEIQDDIQEEPPENSDSSTTSTPEGHRLFSSAAVDVFSDMEEDIRRNLNQKEIITNPPETAENSSVSFDGSHFENKTATNLTKDELSDFFNAQTIENTPVTKEIPPKEPKTNRAVKKGPYTIPSDLLTFVIFFPIF